MFLTTAIEEWFKRNRPSSAAHVKTPNALWPIELMCTGRQQVNAETIDIDRYLTQGLSRIAVYKCSVCVSDLSNFSDGLNCADLIVGCLHRNQQRFIIDRSLSGIEANTAMFVNGQNNQVKSFFYQPLAWKQYGLVFDCRRHDSPPFTITRPARQPQDRQIVAFSGASGKDDFLWRCVDQRPNLLSCILNGAGSQAPPPMIAIGRVRK